MKDPLTQQMIQIPIISEPVSLKKPSWSLSSPELYPGTLPPLFPSEKTALFRCGEIKMSTVHPSPVARVKELQTSKSAWPGHGTGGTGWKGEVGCSKERNQGTETRLRRACTTGDLACLGMYAYRKNLNGIDRHGDTGL